MFYDPKGLDGTWPGVTFVFSEFEVGGGVVYGANYVVQRGVAYDEVGQTRFKMTSTVYFGTQELGTAKHQVVVGGSVGLTVNVTQNWHNETFYGAIYNNPGATIPTPIDAGEGIAINAGISSTSFTLGIGVGVGAKITYLQTTVDQSISLTDAQVEDVDKLGTSYPILGVETMWIPGNPVATKDDKGNISGYSTNLYTVSIKDGKANLVNTGIQLKCAVKIVDGTATPDNIWMSVEYQNEAKKEENQK